MAVQLPRLRDELLRMGKRDQKMRISFSKGSPWDWSLDRKHTERMKAIVRTHGWLTYSMVGKRAAGLAWMLVQHADHDVRWQERCLKLVARAVETGEADAVLLAMLTDRILVNRGKWQMYGTQWRSDRGALELRRPIRDLKQLATRRRAVGMKTFQETKRDMQRRYREWHPGTA